MAQYDIFRSLDGDGYLLDVQTDIVGGLNTRIVVPLLPEGMGPDPARYLNPLVEIDGARHVMATQFLSAVPEQVLKHAMGDMVNRADEITRAIDMVFHGF